MSESTPQRAQTLPIQGFANRLVRGLLATPLIAQGIGRRLVTLYVTGRKSGRRYVIPVAYTRDGDRLLSGSPFGWGRNLRTGEPITIRLRGRLRQADVEVFADEDDVVRLYAQMCRDNRVFAGFNKIALDDVGNPSAADLHAAWVAGARAFRFTPR
ncbi:hypothetical protein ABCS02_34055 [Microbacterium sp. X-17]|uniref:hypothetical protein n=1 Tax=Microbacterium sp. X-17 TaxID=3144404 RepID=UPI0031F5BD07